MNPIKKYKSLRDDLLVSHSSKLAFFKGSHNPDLLIVGEAPGPLENLHGVPFVGPSGKLIDQLIVECGLSCFQVAFLNVVFRMPRSGRRGYNFRKPTSLEIDHYRPMVAEIISYLSPTCILLCGSSACESILKTTSVTSARGKWFGNILPTFHPSYVLRNPDKREIMISDFGLVAKQLKVTQVGIGQGTLRMKSSSVIKAIRQHSAESADDLEMIKSYAASDPVASLTKARRLLESLVSEYSSLKAENLAERINTIPDLPKQIGTKMHFIRLNGNTALHDDEPIDAATALMAFEMLLSIFQWHLQIDEDELQVSEPEPEPEPESQSPKSSHDMKVRFFIADAVHRTWPKLAVLTEDGVLYSEYLAWMKPVVFRKEGFDFNLFKCEDFSFGAEEHGNSYQSIREVEYNEAVNFQLNSQQNWIKAYIEKLGS